MIRFNHITLDESTAKYGSCGDFRFCYGEEVVPKIRSTDIPHMIERLHYIYETYKIFKEEHEDKMRDMTRED